MLFKKEKEEEMVEREDGLTDYNVYVMGKTEKILNMVFAAAVLFAVGYIFYHNVICCLMASMGILFPDTTMVSRRLSISLVELEWPDPGRTGADGKSHDT